MKLYPHQQKARRNVLSALKQGIHNQLIVMPTGGGKTVTVAHIIKSIGGRALFLAHRDELLTQAVKTIKAVMPRASVGLIRAGMDESDKRIVVASVQTLARSGRLARLQNDFKTIIVDEAHHVQAESFRKVLQHFADTRPLILGVTATPIRFDQQKLEEVFDKTVYEANIADGIREGWLADIEGRLIYLKGADFSRVHVKTGDYDLSELEAIMRASNWHEYVARAYFEHARERKTIIFVPKVAMAHQLADWIRGMGGKAEAVDGEMRVEKRRAVIQRLANGELDVIINCAVLTEGFDDPSLSCVIMARPTRSQGLYIQCIGRGIRWRPNKTCLVLDMVGATQRHDLVTLAALAKVEKLSPAETFGEAIQRGDREAEEQFRLEAEMEARRIELVEAKAREICERPHCPRCGGRDMGKGGQREGIRRYICKKCNYRFTPGARTRGMASDMIKWPSCSYCNGQEVTKSGRTRGVQKYTCKSCKRAFTPGARRYRVISEMRDRPNCPNCQSSTVILGSKTRAGSQGYRCKDCGRKFTPEGCNQSVQGKYPPCHRCGSDNTKKNSSKSSPYHCKSCKRSFSIALPAPIEPSL